MRMNKSRYRSKILEFVKEKGILTGPEIVSLIKADRSTVYRNIEKLLADGSLRELNIEKNVRSYESTDDIHHHMVCKNCGKVIHFEVDNSKLKKVIPEIKGFKAEDIEITVKGHCK